jgi:hypothetical protein
MAGKAKPTAARRRRPAASPPSHVVGIGSSAGGLEALEQLFGATAVDTGMAFVVVTHVAPDRKPMLPTLLQRATSMTVREVVDGTRLAANCVYVLPPGHSITVEGGELAPARRGRDPGGRSAARPRVAVPPRRRRRRRRWREQLLRLTNGDVVTRQVRVRGAGGRYRPMRETQSVLTRATNGQLAQVRGVLDDAAR